MKKIFFILFLINQFVNTSASADITKFLGDPYPVDYVFDCIEAKDKLKINTQFGFTKIKPIEDIYGNEINLVFKEGLGDGLGYTSFAGSIFLANINNKILYWSTYSPKSPSEGLYTFSTLELKDEKLDSEENKNIKLTTYFWDLNEAPANLLLNHFTELSDLVKPRELDEKEYLLFETKVQEIYDALDIQLSPISDFSKFKNKEPEFVLNYVCDVGKYIPEN